MKRNEEVRIKSSLTGCKQVRQPDHSDKSAAGSVSKAGHIAES